MNAMNLVVSPTVESAQEYFTQVGAPGAEIWQASPVSMANSRTFTFPSSDEPTVSVTVSIADAPVRPHGIRELASPLSD
jgi:hypothetical protein